jgi:hypothetical protein
MAISLAQIRNLILTSVRGRRLGLDASEFLAGPKDIRKAVTAGTSDTTGTELPNYGLVTVATTTDDGWTLAPPMPGVPVTIATASTSTGTHKITPTGALVQTTAGLAGSTIALVSQGASITLMGLTTAIWTVLARGSTAAVNVSS